MTDKDGTPDDPSGVALGSSGKPVAPPPNVLEGNSLLALLLGIGLGLSGSAGLGTTRRSAPSGPGPFMAWHRQLAIAALMYAPIVTIPVARLFTETWFPAVVAGLTVWIAGLVLGGSILGVAAWSRSNRRAR